MTTVTLQEAQAHLPELFDAVERGEEVVIERNGVIARLVVARDDPEQEIRLGIFEGQAIIIDPDWDAPMDGNEFPAQPAERREPRLGLFAEGVEVIDPNWDARLSDDELREMFDESR